jgi:hypothetical protein
MSQTSDNSRTFRIINLDEVVTEKLSSKNVVVTKHENINYVELASVDDIAEIKSMFDSNNMKYKQCSYSTFVRFKDELTVEQLNALASELCENVNILYSRVDDNNHTGKLVVDRLEDYAKLKSNTGDVNFYRFDPGNVTSRVNTNQERKPVQDNNGWQKVQSKYSVSNRYTQGAGGTGGRGGAQRGRGGAQRGRGGGRVNNQNA